MSAVAFADTRGYPDALLADYAERVAIAAEDGMRIGVRGVVWERIKQRYGLAADAVPPLFTAEFLA